MFTVFYWTQLDRFDESVSTLFHSEIICNFISSSSLYAILLIYNYYPKFFIQRHKLCDFASFPLLISGLLSIINVVSFPLINSDDVRTNHRMLYFVCFLPLCIQSIVHSVYFIYLLVIITGTFLVGMEWMHKPFIPESVPIECQITSESHPLRVDLIECAPSNSIIGMTILPGRTKTVYNRDLNVDVVRLRQEIGANTLVTLIPMNELDRCQSADLLIVAEQNGLNVIYFPFRDKFIPNDVEQFHFFINRLNDCFRAIPENEKLVIHCNGGVGRTGTVTACLLMRLLNDCGDKENDIYVVSKMMRNARKPQMLKNPLQRLFVRSYRWHFVRC